MIGKLAAAAFLFSGLTAFAQSPRAFTIKSAVDRYDLIVANQKASVNGKPAQLKVLSDLWPVLGGPLANACPQFKSAPDVTVTENGKTRSLYIQQGIVSDGKFCLNVGGEGLLYFPIHRDFLIGQTRGRLPISAPIQASKNGAELFDAQKLLNWDFIERFENSLREYDIRFRALPELANGKPKLIVQSNGQSYEFFKITKVMWALKKPGATWLEASDSWSFWYDLDASLIEDRYAPEIRLLKQAGVAPSERQAAMEKLEGSWSRNLRDLYNQILRDSNEDPTLQRKALERLRRKPSAESTDAVVQFLIESNNDELNVLAGQILKTQNPKGPVYKSTLSAKEKAKTKAFWNNWWKQKRKRN